jgi:hypothetical protein
VTKSRRSVPPRTNTFGALPTAMAVECVTFDGRTRAIKGLRLVELIRDCVEVTGIGSYRVARVAVGDTAWQTSTNL